MLSSSSSCCFSMSASSYSSSAARSSWPSINPPGRGGVLRLTALLELLLQIACPFGAALMLLGLRLVGRGLGARVLLALALDLLEPHALGRRIRHRRERIVPVAQEAELVDHRAAEDDQGQDVEPQQHDQDEHERRAQAAEASRRS